jgi:large subunit ribosomal protein L21
MYAVIKTGGKQYKVAKDDVILVEKLDVEAGKEIDLDHVLMIGDGANVTIGQPTVQGARVQATVVDQTKGDKVIIFKKNRRHNYRRKRGHRQNLTVLKITNIKAA